MNAPSRRLPDFSARARAEAERLGRSGLARLLEEGRRWDLAPVVSSGGAVVFPHIGLRECGAQTSAVVHACLDSGAERVLLIGVLHALTVELDDMRRRVASGGDPRRELAHGIQGPGLPGRRDWEREFSLLGFLALWEEAARHRRRVPQLIVRFPYLAGGDPAGLPGVDELEELAASGAVIAATADLFHHGLGYDDAPGRSLAFEAGGLALARSAIEEGFELLARGDHAGYQDHSVATKSDARDVGQLVRHLTGPVEGHILDLVWRDTSADYKAGAPTWVAGALVELVPVRS